MMLLCVHVCLVSKALHQFVNMSVSLALSVPQIKLVTTKNVSIPALELVEQMQFAKSSITILYAAAHQTLEVIHLLHVNMSMSLQLRIETRMKILASLHPVVPIQFVK